MRAGVRRRASHSGPLVVLCAWWQCRKPVAPATGQRPVRQRPSDAKKWAPAIIRYVPWHAPCFALKTPGRGSHGIPTKNRPRDRLRVAAGDERTITAIDDVSATADGSAIGDRR